MKTSETRILTTHAGSLPRPNDVKKLMAAKAAGQPVDAAEFEAAVYAATEAAIEKQIAAGIDVGNDGEQGRESFFTYGGHPSNIGLEAEQRLLIWDHLESF